MSTTPDPRPDQTSAPTPDRAQPAVGSRDWLRLMALCTRAATRLLFEETNTCVATTAIGVRVLEHYGITARPTSVWVSAINGKGFRLREQGVHPSQWPDDAWSIGVRPGMRATDVSLDARTGGWDGHLVLILRRPGGGRTLIDLTADQFDRPQRDLHVHGPVFMDIPRESAWTPRDPMSAITHRGASPEQSGSASANPTIVEYWPTPPADPETRRWRTSPAWTSVMESDDPEVRDVVTGIVADIDTSVRAASRDASREASAR
ncbi:hypothetical protein [Nocardioides sp. Leaf285]|uniref:hypothetical protein n=1 Tax=Nocardioides sp. Leaf285 TaxID=1736322 RepID=UPI00070272C1|nr:hypothetical protein [Nocardioides sp. Leaf285]KQP62920.1 hypothetical protein ASF47_18075 [Nocardioides sp. Leaf285]